MAYFTGYVFSTGDGQSYARALYNLADLGGEVGGARGAAVLVDGAREASVTLALYSSLPWVAMSAARVALPY